MKSWQSSFPLFVLVGYFAIVAMAATSVVADAARLVAPAAPEIETVPFPSTTEVATGAIADLGAMTVTAYRGHGAHARTPI